MDRQLVPAGPPRGQARLDPGDAERERAERRFNDVRKLANAVLFDYHDAIEALPGATPVRERLVKAGEQRAEP